MSSFLDDGCLSAQDFSVDGFQAGSQSTQAFDDTYRAVLQALQDAGFTDFDDLATALPELDVRSHKKYCLQKLEALPSSFTALSASRPWLLFWSLRALSLLGHELPIAFKRKCIHLLSLCQSTSGGFGGGPGQLPHLAPSYAACATLCQMNIDQEALLIVDRPKMLQFLQSLKRSDGSFSLHDRGESDTRGSYCAVAVAHMCGLSNVPGLFDHCGEWLSSCQTFEGGFGGEPGCEAHGGYSYCAVAALRLLKYERWDKSSYMRWVFQRQALEGGFNGRANKLVDGCYSFWQLGGIAVTDTNHLALFDHFRLQRYILATCQYPSGGLLDKVGKSPDLYHTCYVLSGLRLSCLCCEFECARASAEALLNLSRQEVSEERISIVEESL